MGVLRGMSAVSGARHGKGSFYNYTMPKASTYSSFSSPTKRSYIGSRVTKASFIKSNSRGLLKTVTHPGLTKYKAPRATVTQTISKGLHGYDRLSSGKKGAIGLGIYAGVAVGGFLISKKITKSITNRGNKKNPDRMVVVRSLNAPSAQNTQRPAQRTVKQGNHAKGIHQRHKRTFFARNSKGQFS